MINPDDMTPEERAVFDASSLGAIYRLDREWTNVKQAIYEALPPVIRCFFVWLVQA